VVKGNGNTGFYSKSFSFNVLDTIRYAKTGRTVLSDMIGLLNAAVHGAEVDSKAADWAMEVGPRLLKALDERISAIHEKT